MNSIDKNKLKHDFINSIVIVNSMTTSASRFFNTIADQIDKTGASQAQIEKFSYAINAIQEQMTKIEACFHHALSLMD